MTSRNAMARAAGHHTAISAVDKLRLRMNIACMAHRCLALPLIIAWLSLSGLDFDFPNQVELSTAAGLLDRGQSAKLNRNMVDVTAIENLVIIVVREQMLWAADLLFHAGSKQYQLRDLDHAFLI
jgi:hypothetical protein